MIILLGVPGSRKKGLVWRSLPIVLSVHARIDSQIVSQREDLRLTPSRSNSWLPPGKSYGLPNLQTEHLR